MVGFMGVRAHFIGREKGSWRTGHTRRGEARTGGEWARARVRLEVEDAPDGRAPRVGDRGRRGGASWAGEGELRRQWDFWAAGKEEIRESEKGTE